MTVRRLHSRPSSDGAGVSIQRLHGFADNGLDPFLMLDEIHSDNPDDYLAGFPAHPHRGMQTLTYMRQGGFIHKDHLGNHSELGAGGVQWMSAGRGVIHEEMPLQDNGLMHGFQLWINLPAAEKLLPAQYQDLSGEQLGWQSLSSGARLKVLVGEIEAAGQLFKGGRGPLSGSASVADLELVANSAVSLAIPEHHRTLLFIYQGEIEVAGERYTRHQAVQLADISQLEVRSSEGAGLLVLQGKPIAEPVAHYGPFVMNTQQEIDQAVEDYRSGRLIDDKYS